MKYYDKNGNEILAGMHLRWEDGSVQKIYATINAFDEEDLGVNASNEAFLENNPDCPR